VGAGSLGFHHIRILRDVDDAQLVGFFEERTERAAQVSSELGVKSYGATSQLCSTT
jgi:predicted dehydrogenase